MAELPPNPPESKVRIRVRPGTGLPEPLRTSREVGLEELARTADRDRWGLAILAFGWMHLAASLWLQTLMWRGDRTEWKYVATWCGEVAGVFLIMRLVAGRGWFRVPPLPGVVIRVWITYLILAFSMASTSHLSGGTYEWYRTAWATIASFGFATMAWLVDLRFLFFAFQMYFMGLLIVRFPYNAFLTHGLSWCLALSVIGISLVRRPGHGLR